MKYFLICLSSFLILFGASAVIAGDYIEDFEDGNLNPEWLADKTYLISDGRLHMTEGYDYNGQKVSEVGLWLTDELIYHFEADVKVPEGYNQHVGIALQWAINENGWEYQVSLKFYSDGEILASIARLSPSDNFESYMQFLMQGYFNTWYKFSITLHDNYFTFAIDGIETDLFHDLFNYDAASIDVNYAYVHGHDGIPDINYFIDNLKAYSSIICECDFEPAEGDGDIDGSDLATYSESGTGISLTDFAAEFGRTDCL
jgi:hypothetical protein